VSALPRWAERLLKRLLRDDVRYRTIVGDLHEDYAAQHDRPARPIAYVATALGVGVRIAATRTITGVERLAAGIRADVRYAFASYRRSPGFTAGVVLTLALGIGANGAVFSIVRAVLLQPLPYRDPSSLMMVWRPRLQPPANPSSLGLLRPLYARPAPYASMAARVHTDAADLLESASYLSWQGNLEAQFDIPLDSGAERLNGATVTANFFDVLGTPAALGRTITADDEETTPSALVISDSLWRRAFAADRGIIGRSITLLAQRDRIPTPFTVVGVMPASFHFTYPDSTEAWAIMPWARVSSSGTGYWTVARLKPGVSLAVAADRLAGVAKTLVRPNTPLQYQDTLRLEPITEWVVSEARPSVMLLGSVSLLLLLIACATVASALFVRAAERRREVALRAAIGASRGRLIRQLLTEGVVLSLVAAAAGSLAAALAAPPLRALMPPSIPRVADIGVDGSILVFFAAAAAMTSILATLAPAWRGARTDVVAALKAGAGTADPSSARWRRGLIGAQAGVATALLLGASLLIVSFWRLNHVPLGFDGDRVLTVEMRLLSKKYQSTRIPGTGSKDAPPQFAPSPALLAFQRDLVERVRALPGVTDAGLTSAVPFRGVDFTFVLDRIGSSGSVPGKARFVDSGFFSVMNVPVVRGRLFGTSDTAGSPRVMVVSEAYGRAAFGETDPVGQFLDRDGPVEIVGVVRDLRYTGFDGDPEAAMYFPRSQTPNELICLVARLAPNSGNLEPAVRAIIKDLDPDQPAMKMTTINQILSDSVADRRFYTIATSSLASLALLLTTAGLIVVVSRSVIERRRELAIRMALGASSSRLISSVMQQGLVPMMLGITSGLVAVYFSSVLLEQFLFHTGPRAWPLYAAVAIGVLVVCGLAGLLPARRATRLAPAAILKGD
jgi:putative ABC transport system permease protein